MSDLLGVFEKCAKGVRDGILAASDNLAAMLEGFCVAPEPVIGRCVDGVVHFETLEDSVVNVPADAAPVPKPGDSSPSDSAIPPAPEGHPTSGQGSGNDVGDGAELPSGTALRSPSRDQEPSLSEIFTALDSFAPFGIPLWTPKDIAATFRELADYLDPPN